MASSSGSVFSETLQEITNTKLEELSKRRAAFENKKASILSALELEKDSIKRLVILSNGVKYCYAIRRDKSGKVLRGQTKNPSLEIELKNLDSFLAQARHDLSVSPKTLNRWETSLLRHLDMQSLKFEYASLYAQLMTEWLSSEHSDVPTSGGDLDMTEPFEEVANAKKLAAREEWERNVFEPAEVDEQKLKQYLRKLFLDEPAHTKKKAKALKNLHEEIASFEIQLAVPNQFNASTLDWTIRGLLASDLLSDEKREVLKDFQGNRVILAELADVLNMRIAALDSWSWGAGVPLEQRRKISGIYNIHMHEDLLQAIFLQYVGVKWSVFLKDAFKRFRKFGGPWIDVRSNVPKADRKRRGYYLGPFQTKPSVQHLRRSLYRQNYFMAQLLNSEYQETENLEGEEEAEPQSYAGNAAMAQMQAPQQQQMVQQAAMPALQKATTAARRQYSGGHGRGGAKRFRKIMAARDDEDSETDIEDDDTDSARKPMQTKQKLLHLLSTEIAVNTRIHGEISCLHTAYDRFNSLLPHATVRTVLSFFGLSETWLRFFVKFLEAPLKFLDDDPSTPARTRRRGTPASHVLSDIFGEVTLFCLDFAINQSTSGNLLYRLFDDIWFWTPNHNIAITAWQTIQDFTSVTGTQLNVAKTGSTRISDNKAVSLPIDPRLPKGPISWGFLQLSPQTGRFEINQAMVDSHIGELRKQLQGKRKSVFAFIQTWNTYADTFFTSNFGKPANCFGRTHVDAMLATHSRIQREIFRFGLGDDDDGSIGANTTSVVEYLKAVLQKRYGITNIPDAYLFFPVELGGLDLQSPFISILQMRDSVLPDPSSLLDGFQEAELEEYNRAKAAFEKGDIVQERYALEDPDWVPVEQGDQETFFSFEEYTRWREEFHCNFNGELADVYEKLLQTPDKGSVECDNATVASGLLALNTQVNLRGILGNWHSMEPYWRWVVMLYGPEIMERFGGLSIVDPGLLPMGMVSLFREKRVKWQG